MRKFRTVLAVAALATVALLAPSTAQAAAPSKAGAASTQAVQQAWSWGG